MAGGGDLALRLDHQSAGDAAAEVRRAHVDLLDLVADDHDEARDLAVDLRHGGVGDPAGRTVVEGRERTPFGQPVGHVAGVGEVPALVPDVRDAGGVLRGAGAEGDRRVARSCRGA